MKRRDLHVMASTMAITGILMAYVPVQAIVYQQWVAHELSPWHSGGPVEGLGVDSAGNVYIAGSYSFPGSWDDFATIKYAPDGSRLWLARYNGSTLTPSDYAYDLALDSQGNVFITGDSQGPNLAMDYATVKYNTQGQQQWAVRYDGPDHLGDAACHLALDVEGNCYVTGWSFDSDYDADIVTIKYDPQGMEQWVARYDGGVEGDDHPYDIAVDQEGNAYVTGSCDSLYYGRDYVTLKYNSQGVQQWAVLYDSPNHDWDRASAVAVDEEGYVYVTGNCDGPNGMDAVTIKYDPSGATVWVHCYNGPDDENDCGEDLELDSEGNVLITGGTWGAGQDRILTFKLNGQGVQQWVQGYAGLYAAGHDLVVDAEQNVYVTGDCYNNVTLGSQDFTTIKYNTAGAVQWIARYGDPNTLEFGNHMALDNEGSIIVAGSFAYPDQTVNSFLIVKYHQIPGNVIVGMVPTITPIQIPAGGGRFSYHLMAINNVMDSLAVDFWWQVIFPPPSGRRSTLAPLQAILPLDSTSLMRTQSIPGGVPAGTYQYIVNMGDYPGLIWASDTLQFTKLASGEGGLGTGDWSNTGESLESMKDEFIIHNSSFIISARPNPFNPSTAINYQLSGDSHVKLQVFDISGRLVAMLVEGWRSAGVHYVVFDGSNLPSGIFLARITTDYESQTQKLVLMK